MRGGANTKHTNRGDLGDVQLSTWHEPRKLLCWVSCCLIQGISTAKVMLQGFDVDCAFHLGEGVTHKTTALISVIVESFL